MDIHTPIVEKKKLLTSGTSVVVSIPKQWLEEHGLEAGDEVLMIANGELRFLDINKANVNLVKNHLAQASCAILYPIHNPTGSRANGIVEENTS